MTDLRRTGGQPWWLALPLLLLPWAASSSAPGLDAKLEQFRQFLQEYGREHLVLSFSVARVKDGEIVLAEGIGAAVETSPLAARFLELFVAD